jgi:hypothetical protein
VTDPNVSKRVNYQALDALSYFDRELLLSELDKRFAGVDTSNYMGEIYREILSDIDKRTKSCTETITTITGPDETEKNRLFEIRSVRNMTFHPAVEPLCGYLLTAPGEKIESSLVEALGWYNYSYKRQYIIDACNAVIADTKRFSEPVRTEALRTANRLK